MTATPKTSTTLLWLKQLTTNTFLSFHRHMEKIDFLRRSKKIAVAGAACWCLIVLATIFLTSMVRDRHREMFLNRLARHAATLGDDSAPLLMEEDILGLNREIADFARPRQLLFAAVLNHENRVVAHTDAEKFNQPYESFHPISHRSIEDIRVEVGEGPDGGRAIIFLKGITFSGVKIGTALFAVPESTLNSIDRRFRGYAVAVVLLSTLVIGGLVWNTDRRRRQAVSSGMGVISDGTRIGPYRLRDKIAQGGMAELYTADYLREDGFKRQVAIKKVLPHLTENEEFIKMFVREARLAALLQHPNIVQIFDFGKIQNTYMIAMEYVRGMNLGQIMAHLDAPLPVDMAVFIIMNIGAGLEYSHKRKDDDSGRPLGIVHRDVSPQNILISYQGEVKISDFGISKATAEPSLTQAGVIIGKLSYLSPEQALGQAVDRRADIYSLGLVFYEILSGRKLYRFESDIEAIRKIPEMEIPPLHVHRAEVPEAVEQVVMRCLQKDKSQRYADAAALLEDLVRLKNKLQISYDASDLSNFMRTISNHE